MRVAAALVFLVEVEILEGVLLKLSVGSRTLERLGVDNWAFPPPGMYLVCYKRILSNIHFLNQSWYLAYFLLLMSLATRDEDGGLLADADIRGWV